MGKHHFLHGHALFQMAVLVDGDPRAVYLIIHRTQELWVCALGCHATRKKRQWEFSSLEAHANRVGFSITGEVKLQKKDQHSFQKNDRRVEYKNTDTTTTSDLSISSTTPWDPNQEPKK